MTGDKRNRVFWLGQHVVLTKTELPRLRALGFEVFNPPYLADIYDQSAVTEWDRAQPTTLPDEVFRELSQYNFFYNRISPRVAELLNEYFGTVMVTISPIWLESVLEAYHGRIIYRVYGQPGTLADALWERRLFRSVQQRDNFFVVAHAEEAIRDEHTWLKERMTVVPYTIPLDVFEHENTWSPDERHAPEIMACCPNIDNAHFAHHYRYLNEHFPEPYIKLYGVQPREFADPRVAGTLARGELLGRYRRASGYWYHYEIPTSCYLPPIEMMTVGGPVVYMRGSLLARCFPSPGPGEAAGIEDARRKIGLLLAGDRSYVDELRDAQRQIVRRYHPSYVNPIFDRTFRHLIERSDVPRQEPVVLRADRPAISGKRAYVFFHAHGEQIAFQEGTYEARGELAPAVKAAVGALLDQTDHEVVVTCFADQLQSAYGYLDAGKFPRRLRFHVLDHERLAPIIPTASNVFSRPQRAQAGVAPPPQEPAGAAPAGEAATCAPLPAQNWRAQLEQRFWRLAPASLARIGRSRLMFGMLVFAAITAIHLLRAARRARGGLIAIKVRTRAWLSARKARLRAWLVPYRQATESLKACIRRRDFMDELNRENEEIVVVVPHGHLFPEAMFLARPMVLRLPRAASAGAPSTTLRGKVKAHIAAYLVQKAECVLPTTEISQSRLFAERIPVTSQRNRVSAPCPVDPHLEIASKTDRIALLSDLPKGARSWSER